MKHAAALPVCSALFDGWAALPCHMLLVTSPYWTPIVAMFIVMLYIVFTY